MQLTINPVPNKEAETTIGVFNPNINSNYISTLINVNITDLITNDTQNQFVSSYLPMKE
jgi:hypothetical protein